MFNRRARKIALTRYAKGNIIFKQELIVKTTTLFNKMADFPSLIKDSDPILEGVLNGVY